MSRQLCIVVIVGLMGAMVRADDTPNVSQLRKAYDDALVQLKDAQNSKNELAKNNDRLAKQVEDLKKQLATAQRQIQELGRQVAENDEKTFQLRSFYAAWQTYLLAHPDLMARWKRYIGHDALAVPQELRPLIDLGSPLVEDGSAP